MDICAERPDAICCLGNKAVFIPALAEPRTAAGLYLFLLIYVFWAVAIVSDVFMGAIETITSQEKTVMVASGVIGEPKRKIKIKVWNDTVANLTLMALGSSAPEILLSVIELFGNEYFAGQLGPSTIVGSAAFNLFVISAVCVVAIPAGEIRKIEGTQVYAVTCSCSVFAYFWMIVILQMSSPNRVEIWEAVLTFLFFFVLVFVSYAVDVNLCFTRKREASGHIVYAEELHGLSREVTMDMLAKKRKEVKEEFRKTLPEEALMKLVINQLERDQHRSRAHYRIAATRGMAGGKKIGGAAAEQSLRNIARVSICPEDEKYDGPIVEFDCNKYACLECCGQVTLKIVRSTETADVPCSLHWRTAESTDPRRAATGDADYVSVDELLEFAPGECEKEVKVTILDDDNLEDDEDFWVELYSVQCEKRLQLGRNQRAMVTIIDDDEPGALQFTQDEFTVLETEPCATVLVERKAGSTGTVVCTYRTEDDSAVAGKDYTATSGKLTFHNGETSRTLKIPLLSDESYSKKCSFKLHLEKYELEADEQGVMAAMFTEYTAGGEEACICEVTIVTDGAVQGRLDTMYRALKAQREANVVGYGSYWEQIVSQVYVNGSAEDQAEASAMDWALHIGSFPWKMLFSLIPPTDYCQGWVCFGCSLVMIGVVTALVGDLASLLGCALNIPDDISAITLVALGTSLPDTFASKTAAEQDPYADASIGNVTGSNSVNVFLGLGMPWTIGALYWEGYLGTPFSENKSRWLARKANLQGDTYDSLGFILDYPEGCFIVPAGSLAYSVTCFTILALITVSILFARRIAHGGELGGPTVSRYVSAVALVSIWFIYIAMSVVKSIQMRDADE